MSSLLETTKRVGVVGSGIMGSGIGALFANQKIPVTLFDVSEEVAAANLAKLADPSQKLAQLTSPRNVQYMKAASTDAYADLLPECDVIVEVVPEILPLKQKVFAQIDEHRRPGSIVSSNTSGLSIEAMAEGRSDDFKAHFLGTHYFHPVRYMPLVELIPNTRTRPEVTEQYATFFRRLGKKPVIGRDTPNFIANRIGVFSIMRVLELMERYRLTVEMVDLVTGPPIGHPKTASLRLSDMVGLDTLLHVSQNSYDNCPDDEVRAQLEPHPLLKKLVEAGRLGQKSGEGFYAKAGKGKILALDLGTFEYRPADKKPRHDLVRVAKEHPAPGDRIRAMITGGDDPVSAFAREVVLATSAYALNRVGEVAGDILTIDQAMKWGFGRELGPIETLQEIGLELSAELMEGCKVAVPALLKEAIDTTGRLYGTSDDGRTTYFVSGQAEPAVEADDPAVLSLARLRHSGRLVRENLSSFLTDLGDGVLCFSPAARMVPNMNPVDDFVMSMLERGHDLVAEGKYRALVIGNQAQHFCAGANLKAVLELAEAGKLDTIRAMVKKLQTLNMRGVHAAYPVVSAPHGMTLGGGLEVALGAQVRVVASELYAGLVEVGVGLVPAGAGCLRLLQLQDQKKNLRGGRHGPMQNALAAFDMIGFGKVSSSGQHAKAMGLIEKNDVVCFAKDEQLRVAKEVALARLDGFEAIPEQPVALPGNGGYLVVLDTVEGMLRGGKITPHAARIAKIQGRILTGGPEANPAFPTSEERILELECEAFVELVQTPETQARMKHMLKTGKPLFN